MEGGKRLRGEKERERDDVCVGICVHVHDQVATHTCMYLSKPLRLFSKYFSKPLRLFSKYFSISPLRL